MNVTHLSLLVLSQINARVCIIEAGERHALIVLVLLGGELRLHEPLVGKVHRVAQRVQGSELSRAHTNKTQIS